MKNKKSKTPGLMLEFFLDKFMILKDGFMLMQGVDSSS